MILCPSRRHNLPLPLEMISRNFPKLSLRNCLFSNVLTRFDSISPWLVLLALVWVLSLPWESGHHVTKLNFCADVYICICIVICWFIYYFLHYMYLPICYSIKYIQLTPGLPVHPDALYVTLPLPWHRHWWHVRHRPVSRHSLRWTHNFRHY